MAWVYQIQACCSSDGTPVSGTPISYDVIDDETEMLICSTYSERLAALVSQAPDMLKLLEGFVDGTRTDKQEAILTEKAKTIINFIEEKDDKLRRV